MDRYRAKSIERRRPAAVLLLMLPLLLLLLYYMVTVIVETKPVAPVVKRFPSNAIIQPGTTVC